MKIRDLFVADVTRDIPPVVYFHEKEPAKLRAEVGEYIITGGYPGVIREAVGSIRASTSSSSTFSMASSKS
jgi:hypothetical protein